MRLVLSGLLLAIAGCHVLLPLDPFSPQDAATPDHSSERPFGVDALVDISVDGGATSDTWPDLAQDQAPAPDLFTDQAPVADQAHAGPLRVFVTSQPYSVTTLGNLGKADGICQLIAKSNGLGGTWKAWLSDSNASPSTRFTRGGPYSRLDNVVVADSWQDLTNGTLDMPIDVSEKKQKVTSDLLVWTGTNPDGTADLHTCNGWTDTAAQGTRGQLNLVSSWSSMSVGACTWTHRLYCFEQ